MLKSYAEYAIDQKTADIFIIISSVIADSVDW